MTDVTIKVIRRPTLAIKFVYWVFFVLIGIYVLSPFYVPNPGPVADGLFSFWVIKAYGTVLLTTGASGLFALFRPNWKYSHQVLEVAMFVTFIIFIFFTILRVTTFGFIDLAWVSYAINAVVAGVVHFKLHLEK